MKPPYALLLLAGLSACAHEPPAEHPPEAPTAEAAADPIVALAPEVQRSIGLRTAKAERRSVPVSQYVLGQVTARPEAEAVVHAPISGRIVALHAAIGDRVAKGAVLATVESAELGAAQASYLKAVGAARLADREAGRVEKLFAAELSSRKELEGARAERETARLAQAEAAEQLRVLGYTDADLQRLARRGRVDTRQAVLAPAAGTVIAREAALGDRAVPDAEAPMFRLLDLSTVRVEAELPERDFLAVKPGQSAAVALEALGGRTVPGRVVKLSPVLDPASRTGKALVDVPNRDGGLRPGMSCRVRIETGRQATLLVPALAVQQEARQAYAYVQESPNRFREAPLKLGAQIGADYPVLSGLQPGDTVVTTGSFDLRAQARKAQFGGD